MAQSLPLKRFCPDWFIDVFLFVFLNALLTGILITDGIAQMNVGSITVKGNSAISTAAILQQFETQPGNPLIQPILEQDIQFLISRYEKNGYPFAQISIESIMPVQVNADTNLNVVVSISEGQLVRIKELRPVGNKETKSNVIIRETGIGTDDIYDHDRVSKIQYKLNRLNIFGRVGEPGLTMGDSGGIIVIPVEEGRTNTFDGVLGYIPASGGNEGYLTGLVSVSMRNLFGTARKLNVFWQREGKNTQEITLRYGEPWIFNFPVDAGIVFNQRQQDSTYVKRGYELKADIRLFDEVTVGGIFSYESIIPSNTVAGNALPSTKTTTTGIELRYDSRDDAISPTSGVVYRSDYHFGKKTSTSSNASQLSSTVQKLGIDFAFLIQPLARQVVSIELHGKRVLTDNIGIGEMFRLGGATTLRGYRENQFLGSTIAWTNLEYRFLLSRKSFFFGFFDTGYYFLPENPGQGIASSQALKYGYGIGTRIETGIGILGVSFALGKGDSFNQGKIHFGLINEF